MAKDKFDKMEEPAAEEPEEPMAEEPEGPAADDPTAALQRAIEEGNGDAAAVLAALEREGFEVAPKGSAATPAAAETEEPGTFDLAALRNAAARKALGSMG